MKKYYYYYSNCAVMIAASTVNGDDEGFLDSRSHRALVFLYLSGLIKPQHLAGFRFGLKG
jgi:hypothetical protein